MMNDLILKNKKNRLCLFRLLFLFLLFPVSNVRAGAPAYVGDVYITAPPDESTATLPTATIQAKAYETENELTEVRIGIDDVACTNMGLMTRVSGGGGSAADPGVFEYTWNTESCTNGSHNICAQAYDAADAKYKISGTSVVYCYTPPDFTLSPGDIIFNPLSAGFNESIQISATVYKTGGPTIAGGVTVGTPDGGVGNTDAYFTMLDLLKPIDADGVITEWKVWFTDINSQARLRIFRDDGTNYVFVGESQLETPVPDVVNTYATSIAVQAGDKVGLYWTQGYVYIGYYTAASGIMYINADQTGTSLKTAWTAYAAQLDLEVSGVTYTAGTVKFYDSDPDSGGVQIGATQDINILNDDSQTVSIDWSTDTEKYHDIYVYVDREDLVDESNETNNKAFNAVLVSSAPDAVKDLTAGASTTLSINLDWHATGDDGYTGVLNNSTFTVQYTSVTAWAEGNSWSTNTATVPGYVYTTEIATTGVTAGSQRFYTQTVEVGMSNTIYYFRLWTKDDVGTYSGLSNGATASTLAEPVISTQIYSVFYTSVTLNWLPHPLSPSSATCEGYKLQASTAPDFTGVVYSSVTSSVNVSTLTLEALGTNTTYYFRAGSLNWYEEPNYILAGSTCTLKPPPGASPFDPEISAVFMSSMTMTWTSASSDDGYLVQASTALDFTGTISSSETADGTLETLTVSEPSLDSNTTYYLRVGALWGETTSYAATQAASTLANPLASAQYQGVFITSAAVSWPALPASPPDASSKTCEGYQAQASTASNFTGAVFSSSTLSAVLSTLTVSGLSPNTTYYFRAGPLNWQSVANYLILTATPTLVSPPGQALPTALSVSSYSITAQWTAGDPENPSGTNYTLEMSSTDFEAGTEIFSQDTTDLQAEVSGLMANTTYYIRPKAVNWALIESYGVTAATSTLTRLVEGATYYSVAITSVVVNWLELPAEPSSATCRGYIVEASTASDFTGEILSSSTINGVAPSTLTVKNLYSETEYYFRAGAYNWNFVPNYVLLGSTETKTAVPPPDLVIMDSDIKFDPTAADFGWVVKTSATIRNLSYNFLETVIKQELEITPLASAYYVDALRPQAQGIVPPTDMNISIKSVDMMIMETGTTGDLTTVKITTGTTSLPSTGAAVLASKTIAISNITWGAWVTIAFDDWVPLPDLPSGGAYWIIASNPASAANGSMWEYADTDAYTPAPRAASADGGLTWTATTTEDNTFRVYLSSSIVISYYRGDPDADGTFIGVSTIAPINTNQTRVSTISWTAPSVEGSTNIYVYVDKADKIIESDETNNKAFNAIAISSAPDAVKTLTASTNSATAINLKWYATGDDGYTGNLNNSTFTIQYTADAAWAQGNDWNSAGLGESYVYTVNIATTGVTAGSERFYTQTGLSVNTTYYFRLWILDDFGRYSSLSNGATVCTLAAQPGAPSEPFAGVYFSSVSVLWLANGNPDWTEYRLQASTASNFTGDLYGPYAGPTGWLTGTSTDTVSLNGCTTYYFQVQARNNALIETDFQLLGSTRTVTYFDAGLRVFDGTQTVPIACQATSCEGGEGSPIPALRIHKDGVNYAVGLVDEIDPSSSTLKIQTPDGIKYWRKY